MIILFCSEPFAPHRPDPDFVDEWQAAGEAGFETALFSYEDLQNGDVQSALGRIRLTGPCLYRGWMLAVETYTLLYQRLLDREVQLVNTPEAYRFTHHFPPSYDLLAGRTPESYWLNSEDLGDWDGIYGCLCQLGSGPAVVKDFVKSRKHEWTEACFIPDLNDEAAARRVVECFIERQDDSLQGGLVFRRYISLKTAGQHPLSGMPISQEYRRFYLDGQRLGDYPYWEAGQAEVRGADSFDSIALQVPSRFFTLDYAMTAAGEEVVIELGDGQVAGRPPGWTASNFYNVLVNLGPMT